MAFDFPLAPAVDDTFAPPGGPTYTWDGIAWITEGAAAIDTSLFIKDVKIRYVTSSETYTVPSNLICLEVDAIGGGGCGGGAPATDTVQVAIGSGGGSGAYSRSIFKKADLSATVAITIAAGGVGIAGSGAVAGGTTSFGALISAGGGAGGLSNVAPNTTNCTLVVGGLGGASGVNAGNILTAMGGAGGDSMTNLAPSIHYVGGGGDTMNWYIPRPPTMAAVRAAEHGHLYGGGAPGTCHGVSTPAKAGGNGAAGVIILKEYLA